MHSITQEVYRERPEALTTKTASIKTTKPPNIWLIRNSKMVSEGFVCLCLRVHVFVNARACVFLCVQYDQCKPGVREG